ncbi:hypothetical protein ACROYT_G019894 [Oculina patagonica]
MYSRHLFSYDGMLIVKQPAINHVTLFFIAPQSKSTPTANNKKTNSTMLNHDGNRNEALRMALVIAQRGPLRTALESFPLVFVMLTAFLGNSLVLWAVKCNPRLRTTPNYYVTALALTDLLMSILVMPLSLSVLIAGRWPFNEVSCAYHGYTATTLGSASILILTLTSVNRYFKVVRPNQYRAYFKVKPVLMSLLLAWLIALAWPVYFLVKGVFSYHPGKFCCIYDLDQETGNGRNKQIEQNSPMDRINRTVRENKCQLMARSD